jgi:hypothetical protein
MNRSFLDVVGGYVAEMHAALVRPRMVWVALALVLGWSLFPFGVQTLLHPGDAVRLVYVLHGLPKPHALMAQQLAVGFTETAVALATLALLLLVLTVVFYRRAQVFGVAVATPPLWPMAALVPGGLGNLAWFIGTGSFDSVGFIIGLTSTAVTIAAEMLCEQLGRDFVLGPAAGFHP